MTELCIPEQIFAMIGQGASAVQLWDGYDSVYLHAILAGTFIRTATTALSSQRCWKSRSADVL